MSTGSLRTFLTFIPTHRPPQLLIHIIIMPAMRDGKATFSGFAATSPYPSFPGPWLWGCHNLHFRPSFLPAASSVTLLQAPTSLMYFEVSCAPSRGLDLQRLIPTHFFLQFEDFFLFIQLWKELTQGACAVEAVFKFGAAVWDEGCRAGLRWRTAMRASQAGGQMQETQCLHHCSFLLFHLSMIRKGVT